LARLDLSLAQGEDAGVVFEGLVVGHDPHYDLLDLRLPGGSGPVLRIAHPAHVMGSTLRVKVQARDVSLALAADSTSSI
ncbi:molybdenum ABC transporter ATP-binding protein, partial [Pseudomonas sp. SIMBA_021]